MRDFDKIPHICFGGYFIFVFAISALANPFLFRRTKTTHSVRQSAFVLVNSVLSVQGCFNKGIKQFMGFKRSGFKFRMKLHSYKEGVFL